MLVLGTKLGFEGVLILVFVESCFRNLLHELLHEPIGGVVAHDR